MDYMGDSSICEIFLTWQGRVQLRRRLHQVTRIS